MLARYSDSLDVKYLAVLVFIMSPKAMSSFTVSIRFVCNECVCLCVYVIFCVCTAWHQPRSIAKLPISGAQSIKSPFTNHHPSLAKKKHTQIVKMFSCAVHSCTYSIYIYLCILYIYICIIPISPL